MIEVSEVGMKFSSGTPNAVVALADVSLTVRAGEFLSLIGPSGCGKTTLLKILDGLLQPTEGEVRIDGKHVSGPGPDRAVVFQDFALLPWATVIENVEFGLEIKGVERQERREIAARHIKKVGLAGFESKLPHHLSGGMQQRVGLARAMAVDPAILLMDEPFGALDAQTRHLQQEDLRVLLGEANKTVVFVTHDMDEAVYLSDRVAIMYPRPGRIAEVLDVDLPPDDAEVIRRSAKFGELTSYVWERLREVVREQEALEQ